MIEPAELDAIAPKKTKTIEIEDFVELAQIDPVFYDHPYYLAPGTGGAKPYRLLLEAMRETGKVAIARVVIRSKEQLVALRPMGDALGMATMIFADEVLSPDRLDELADVAAVKSTERELDIAKQLVDSLAADFEPERYTDTYREEVLAMIERKAEGKQIAPGARRAAPRAPAPDLMSALKASLDAVRERQDARANAHAAKPQTRQSAAGRPGAEEGRAPPAKCRPPSGRGPQGSAAGAEARAARPLQRQTGLRARRPSRRPARGSPRAEPRFVIHEHHARRLHWDLRLEHDGALASWAVPKGLPEEPGENRFAAATEDHPLEYLDFHGEIPRGRVRRRDDHDLGPGTYETLKWEPRKVEVALHGSARATARYALFPIDGERPAKDWMIHRMDPPQTPRASRCPTGSLPMLARAGELPPDDGRWAYEIKWDGVRALAYCRPGELRAESRNLNDITAATRSSLELGRALGSHSGDPRRRDRRLRRGRAAELRRAPAADARPQRRRPEARAARPPSPT